MCKSYWFIQLGCLNPEEITSQSVPKSLSTVSIQTVPIMSGIGGMGGVTGYTNGEISTISRTLNGGTRLQVTRGKDYFILFSQKVKIWKCFIGKWERCIQMKMIIHWVVQYQYEMTVIDIHAMHFNSLYSNKSFKQDIIAARVEISFWISETLFLNGTIYNTWALVAPFLFI